MTCGSFQASRRQALRHSTGPQSSERPMRRLATHLWAVTVLGSADLARGHQQQCRQGAERAG
jgi:hypothetical protein